MKERVIKNEAYGDVDPIQQVSETLVWGIILYIIIIVLTDCMSQLTVHKCNRCLISPVNTDNPTNDLVMEKLSKLCPLRQTTLETKWDFPNSLYMAKSVW